MIDVLIAGAGPAGAIAAIILARAGARVVVMDRATFPRAKLCGDSVNPGAVAILRRLGLESALAGGIPVHGMIVTGADGVRVEGRYGGVQGCMVRRRDMDAALVREAAAAGARIDEGVLVEGPMMEESSRDQRVTGLTVRAAARSSRVCAAVVIAADGRYSRVARPLGLSHSARAPRRWAAGAYFQGVEGLSSCGEMHVRPGHYLGVAPLPGGLANACAVTADREALRDPSALLMRALQGEAHLAARFARAERVSDVVCLGPLAVECTAAGMPGLLLAGDAAGFVDPMTGDGLRLAFRGGELAAAAALHALEHGPADAHLALGAARRAAFGRKVRFNRGLRALVSSPAAVRAAGAGAAIAPAILQRVIRYAGDVAAA